MLDDTQLQDIECQASEIVRSASEIILRYFDQPLNINYKSVNSRNPVTDADNAADEFLRTEIARRFPDHAIVTEETESESDEARDITWVVDPLDGTTNFLHGLPMFAVMVAVLEKGEPVVGAIYIPRIGVPGYVLHARRGGGAFADDIPLSVAASDPPRRMASVPVYFLRMFAQRRSMRRRLGDLRTTGSAGYELAMTARGVFDYAVFNGPWVWDLAAGTLIVKEAGGTALIRDSRTRRWTPFETFASKDGHLPRPSELRQWHGSMVLGRPATVEQITGGIAVRTYPVRNMRRRLSRLLGRARSAEAAPTPAPPKPTTSAGTGESGPA